MKNSVPDPIAASNFYQQVLAKIHQPHKPLPLLRCFFAVALGYREPVSQTVFAGWCGVNRGLIANLETRKQKIPDAFADRVWRISGASREWLRGNVDIGTYGYDDLQRWYPESFPRTKTELMRLADSSSTKSEVIRYWRYVIEPFLKYTKVTTGKEAMIEPFMLDTLKEITGENDQAEMKRDDIWKAYAFSDHPSRVRDPLDKGLLGVVLEKATAMGHQVERSNVGEVLHYTIFLRGLSERERKING